MCVCVSVSDCSLNVPYIFKQQLFFFFLFFAVVSRLFYLMAPPDELRAH